MSELSPVEAAPRGWRLALRAIAVRLRFAFVVGAAALLAALWPSLRIGWDRLFAKNASGEQAVGLDSEFFCPMCPGVASEWPSKCPVCHMTLVRRSKGDATVLPDGVVTRMQLTPYRIQLAGVRSVAAEYLPLERELITAGKVHGRDIEVTIDPADEHLLGSSTKVEAIADSLPSRPMVVGKIAKKSPRKIVVSLPEDADWPEGLFVTLRFSTLLAELEPFRARTQPPPLSAASPRSVYRCPNHPDPLRDRSGKCPIDGVELERRRLADNERVDWWCPMHPKRTSDRAGEKCSECDGMVLLPRVTAFAPAGKVLAVPRSAVVQSGSRQVVYIQTMPGMFDGRIVKLGAPVGDHFPVLEGISASERVVASGAFLLDAESRLNPSLAAAYFGSGGTGRNAARTTPPKTETPSKSSSLSAADRKLAAAQKICPVTSAPLDSMGGPVRIEVNGRTVFLCCEGCEEAVRKDPKKYLAKIPPSAGQ
jgi:membrane fusion protein, copper/silver efflux system